MSVNSIVMGVEDRRTKYTKYRFNKYLVPFVDCTITLYAELGEPVPISDIADCMRDYHGITGVRNVYEGRDAALNNGYVETESVGGRTRYVPVGEGVVHTAIYLTLGDVVNSVPPHALPFLIECLRTSLVTILIPKIIQSIPDYIRAIKDAEYAIHLVKVQKFVEEFLLSIEGVRGEELNQDKALELIRNSALVSYVALKMLSGIPVNHLEPKHYNNIKEFIKTITTNLIPTLPNPRLALIQLLLTACRNTATRITAMTR
jgi:hypothetical protein